MKQLKRLLAVTLILTGLICSMSGMQAFAWSSEENYDLPVSLQSTKYTSENWDDSNPLTEYANDLGSMPILLEIKRIEHNLRLVTSDKQRKQMQEQIDMWYSRLDQLGY